jgi:CheY-like chemotaxis protein
LLAGRKLLLADDSVTIQKVIDLTFADEGMEVITVGDGEQAIEKIEQLLPDIVLLDVFMPILNGYEVCDYIKRSEKLKHIPVMLLVGSFEPFDEAEARRVGANDTLTKPFQSIRRLIDRVGGLVSKTPDSEGPTAELPGTEPPEQPKLSSSELEFVTADTRKLAPDAKPIAPEPVAGSWVAEPAPGPVVEPPSIAKTPVIAEPPAIDTAAMAETIRIPEVRAVAEPRLAPEPSFTRETAFSENKMESEFKQAQSEAAPLTEMNDTLLDLDDFEPEETLDAGADDFILDLDLDEPGAVPAGMVYSASAAEAKGSAANWEKPERARGIVGESDFYGEPLAGELVADESQFEPQPHRGRDSQPILSGALERSAGEATFNAQSLSPEVIDAIARRAVEYLSEKVVREIAWEVVPQLAELLIKRQLEQKESQNK